MKYLKALTCCTALGLLGTPSDAAVTVTFQNFGTNLRAYVNGTLDLSGLNLFNNDTTGAAQGLVGPGYVFGGLDVNFPPAEYGLGFAVPSSFFDSYTGGSMSNLSVFAGMHAPNYFINEARPTSGDPFWFREYIAGNSASLMVRADTPANGVADFLNYGYFEWVGRSTASFAGTASLTTTPVTVWNNPNAAGTAGAIQFVLIPEPSAAWLFSLGAVSLLRRRKR